MAKDRVAVVAGGSAGVGRAVVSALLDKGYKVAVCARGEERLAAMREEIGAERLLATSVDVADAAAMEGFAKEVVETLGVPSVWVNSAMLTAFSPFREMPPEEFEQIVAATFMGQVNGTRAALRVMERGRIVNIGSGLAYRPVPFQSAYCAAKHAINGFTGSIASELMREKSGVSLALVQLPAVNTPQFTWARNRMKKKPQPAPPIYTPELAAKAVMKAAEGDAREIFVGKSVMQLVFGTMVLPAWLDKKLAEDGVETQKSDEAEPGDREDNLETPAEHPATADGRFGDRASSDGWIVDADLARKVVFFGVPALAFLLGLVIG
ncbi:SDR family oxidoreductase [Aestuariibius sp. 2305UL40-4]|uniref:SDR family oxidoreductase n=1 Tax=Aestuariibius violaceus TaxID=3234132 RepID=UPI00345F0977